MVELTEQAAEFAERELPRTVFPVVPPNGDGFPAAHEWLLHRLEGQRLGSRDALCAKTMRELDATGDRLQGFLGPRHAQERLQGRGVEQRVLAETHQAQFGAGTPEFVKRLLSSPFGVTRPPRLRSRLCYERIEFVALSRQIRLAYPVGPAIPSTSLASEPTRPRTCRRCGSGPIEPSLGPVGGVAQPTSGCATYPIGLIFGLPPLSTNLSDHNDDRGTRLAMKDPWHIGPRMRYWRKQRGMTIAGLADLIRLAGALRVDLGSFLCDPVPGVPDDDQRDVLMALRDAFTDPEPRSALTRLADRLADVESAEDQPGCPSAWLGSRTGRSAGRLAGGPRGRP